MNDVAVIDRFLDVFSRYIDSGFGLLGGEVRFLSATLIVIVIDVTLAGLFWAMGHASGQGDDVIARLIKKVLYVGAFAFIIGNFNRLAGILFQSFAGLGLTASGSGMTQAQFLRPGQLAKVGIDAGRPIMAQISELTGFPEVFANLDVITVLFLAWLVLIVSFFVLAVQLFVTLIEFKLTTLAGFVLVPFALWNKTAFLAEKVLGNVISSGIKVLVLAVIVGIGSGLFAEFRTPAGAEPSIDHALVIMLAALAMLGLGIFGPGIATGLVSGAPQVGAGAAVGTAIGATGLAVAGGAAVAGAGSAVAAGARMAPGAAKAAIGSGASAARSVSALASGAKAAYQAGAEASGGSGAKAAGAGVRNVAKAGAAAVGQRVASGARAVRDHVAGFVSEAVVPAGSAAETTSEASTSPPTTEPAWAQRMRRRQQATHAATTAAHALRSGDHGGSGSGPSLRDDSNS
ncbi:MULTISPECIES: P-type conjugative transfer protein TrbL [unclassified Acidovorax]|uniref:P-type conjugative transfer protein TrbL n=1 Tax=unclassified Acidovorax TaxID=2684926 RepID=UPI001C479CB1|nr:MULTISPECIES: P-type conjugative transfer protein TrbL [unclassified Acidovorax]MBV7427341.1 P-type conjugative transfer protein TrbL [Acidovorax sp. sif0732]MBV7448465.1 P-type conjugative transfer protein TrbL [Acidovorax sp. sif0715]